MQKESEQGGMAFFLGGTMPAYEICYMNPDGSLACTLSAMCRDDMHAKVLAHAMKLGAYKRFEVWRDKRLVYERPQYFGPAACVDESELVPAASISRTSPAQQPFA
jgi:hypothetical protein